MEGAGETTVAIIQGLRDSGLAVTLMTVPRVHYYFRSRRRLAGTKSSVQINTEAKRAASAQICDAHYASSYQLAHCRLIPNSPSADLPEFPLQRKTPSRTQGNFKVGKCRSAHWTGGTEQHETRGSFCRSPSHSFLSDSFVSSLRNYPLASDRKASTELVQRLLNYTQTKHISRDSSRSMRSPKLSHDSKYKKTNYKSNKPFNKASKNIQTYTRIVKGLPTVKETPVEIKKSRRRKPSVDVMLKSDNVADQPNKNYNCLNASTSRRRSYAGRGSEVRYMHDVKRYIRDTIRLMVPQTPIICPKAESRFREHVRSHHHDSFMNQSQPDAIQSDQPSETYDYLKVPASCSHTCTGQYLDFGNVKDIKRYIRETIRKIIDNSSTQPCPRARNRYREHCRLNHRTHSSTSPILKNEEQDSTGHNANASTDVTCDPSCSRAKPLADVCPSVMNRYKEHRRKYHNEIIDDDSRPPCASIEKRETQRSRIDVTEEHDSGLKISDNCKESNKSESENKESVDESDPDIEKEVLAWLKQLPVYMDSTEEYQAIYQNMANDLAEKLRNLKGVLDYDERALEEIDTFLNSLPVSEDEDEEEFDDTEEVGDVDIPTEVKSVIFHWLNCMDLDTKAKKGKLIAKDRLLNKFMNRLEPIVERSGSPKELKAEVLKMLPKLEEGFIENDHSKNEIREHVDDLVNELSMIALHKQEKNRCKVKKGKSIKPVSAWLMDNKEILKDIKEKLQNFAHRANENLQQMFDDDADDKALANLVMKFLDALPHDKISLNPKKKSQSAENFSNEIKSEPPEPHITSLKIKKHQGKSLLQNIKSKPNKIKRKQPVSEWLENNPNIPVKIKKLNRNLFKSFDKKLNQLQSQNINNDVIKDEIKQFLDTLEEEGIPLTLKQKSELSTTLLNQLNPKEVKKIPQPESDLLEFGHYVPEDFKQTNQHAINTFDKKQQRIKSINISDDVIRDDIEILLDSLSANGIYLKLDQKNNLATKILKYLESSKQPESDWLESFPHIPEEEKQRTQGIIQNFNNNGQRIRSQGIDEDATDDTIREFLESLSETAIPFTDKQKNEVAKNILQKVKPKQSETKKQPVSELDNTSHISKEIKQDNILKNVLRDAKVEHSEIGNQPLSDWLETAPSIPEEVKQNNFYIFKQLDKKIQQMKAQNVSVDLMVEEIKEFMNALANKAIQRTPKQKHDPTKNLLGGVKEKPSVVSKQPASDWLENVPQNSEEVKQRYQNMVKRFGYKIKIMKAQNVDDHVITEEINKFLNSLANKGIQLMPKQIRELTEHLLEDVNAEPNISTYPVLDSLENSPQIPEIKTNVTKKVDNKLQQIKTLNIKDDYMKKEMKEFINVLPKIGIQLTPKQKRELTKYILKDVKAEPNIVNKKCVSSWLEKTSQVPEKINQNVIKNVDMKSQQIKGPKNGGYMEDEIKEFIDALLNKGIQLTPKQKHEFTKNVLVNVNSESNLESKQPVLDWLKYAPQISEEVKRKNQKVIEDFDKKLQQIKAQNAGVDIVKKEIKEFVETLSNIGMQLTPIQKCELTKHLLIDVKAGPSFVTNHPVSDWSENTPQISENVKHKNLIINSDNKIQELKAQVKSSSGDTMDKKCLDFTGSISKKGIQDAPEQKIKVTSNLIEDMKSEASAIRKQSVSDSHNDNILEDDIKKIVESLPRMGIPLSYKEKAQIISDLIDKVKAPSKHRKRWDQCEHQEKIDEISGNDDYMPTYASDIQKKNISQSIGNFLTSHTPGSSSDYKAENKSISGKEVTVPNEVVPHIAQKIISAVKNMHLPEFGINRQSNITEVKLRELVQEEVHNILSEYNIPAKNANRIDNSIANTITDQIIRNTNDNELKNNVISALKNANLSDKVAQEISDKLIQKSKDVSASFKNLVFLPIQPFENKSQKQELKETINNVVLDFFKKVTRDCPRETRNENITMTLAAKLTEIMSNSNEKYRDTRTMREILQFLEKERFDVDISYEELANLLNQRLKEAVYQTSNTQQKEDEEEEKRRVFEKSDSYIPDMSEGRLSKPQPESDVESNDDDAQVSYFSKDFSSPLDKTKNNNLKSNAKETEYMDELLKNIKLWLHDVSLDSDDDDDIQTIIEGFAKNIAKRKNYLQQNNKNHLPDESKLKYLNNLTSQLQNKFVEDENLPSHRDIRTLIDDMTDVPIKRDFTIKDVENTVIEWLNNTNVLSSAHKSMLNDNVPDLIEQILNRIKSDDITSLFDAILDVLTAWIQSVNPDIGHDNLSEVTKEIQSALKQQNVELGQKPSKNFTNTTKYIQDPSKFVKENIKKGLLDCLKQQSWYEDRSADEKRVQEKYMDHLADKLTTIIKKSPPNSDMDSALLKEIKKTTQNLPVACESSSIQRFVNELPQQIFEHVKFSQNIPLRNSEVIVNNFNKWSNNLPILAINSVERAHFEDLKSKFIDKIKHIQPGDESKLRDIIRIFLDNAPLDLNNDGGKEAILKRLEDQIVNTLLESTGGAQTSKPQFLETPYEFLKLAVEEWVQCLDLPEGDTRMTKNAEDELIKNLTNEFIKYGGQIPLTKENNLFKHFTAEFLDKNPGHSYKAEDIAILATSLNDKFTEQSENYVAQAKRHVGSSFVKKGADFLLDGIAGWVKNLPIEYNTPEEKATSDNVKKEIKSKLIHKIGELNMNPGLYNDDFLYEEMLGDEADNFLSIIPSKNVKKQQSELKKLLLDIVRKARQKIRDENAGQIYKQQLRDSISMALPSFVLNTPERRASFEVLKNYVADTFINMHYVDNDREQINELKNKIFNEIYKFCIKYFEKCPVTLDTRKVNKDLLMAMKNVQEPQNKSFKYEVELVKIKNEINNWLKELPLMYQSGLKKLQTNKMVSILAKKLYDIENKKDFIGPDNCVVNMKKEIITLLNKLPLAIVKEEDINRLAEKVIQKLKDTEATRRITASNRHSITSIGPCISPCYILPPCILSKEDLDHLESIKKRNEFRRKLSFNNVSSSPCSVDAGNQTELARSIFEKCANPCIGRRSSSAQTPCRRMQAVGSQIEVSPNVVIKEHYWESVDQSQPHIPCETQVLCPSQYTIPQQFQSQTTPVVPKPRQQSQIQCTNPSGSQTRLRNSQHQMPYRPAPCRPEQHKRSQAKTLGSPPTPSHAHPLSSHLREPPMLNNQFLHLSSRPAPNKAKQNPQRSQARYQNSQYFDSSRHIPQGRYNSSHPYPEPAGELGNRRYQENKSLARKLCTVTCPSRRHQNQSGESPQSIVPLSSSNSREILRPTSRACRMSGTPPVTSEDYEAGPSCSFQKRVTHLGSFDHIEPHGATPRFYKRGKMPDIEYWERDRNKKCFAEELRRKRYRCNENKCGKYNGKRIPCHVYLDESMNKCAKCCGVHCPFPSYLFFRS